MKKYLILPVALLIFAACNNKSEKKVTEDTTAVTDNTRTDLTHDSVPPSPPVTLDTAGASMINDVDRDFVAKAVMSNAAEVDLGKLAASKSTTAGIKEFADMLVMDHSAVLSQLKSIASNYSLTASETPDAEKQATKTKLEGLSGAAFEKEFIATMVKGHKASVALFQKEINGGGNSKIKDLASKVLPKIQEHLKKAQGLQTTTK